MSLAGKLLYQAWHRPLGFLRSVSAAGGLVEAWRTASGRRAMESAASALPPLPKYAGQPVELHLLTGRRFWYQTVFCLWSFAQQIRRPLAPMIYDDGTLTVTARESLARIFPGMTYMPRTETLARLEKHLPASRFPCLRERWLHYPNLRKITDPHIGRHGWKLVIDSDLLFFHRPDFLLSWLDHPGFPLHAVDTTTAYGYPTALMSELAGAAVADLVNVGLTGLESESIDWEKLEHWTTSLIALHGTHYYLEQALVAMLLAGRRCAIAPAADYVTGPLEPEATECRAVMHHYVASSKKWYFQHNWKHCR